MHYYHYVSEAKAKMLIGQIGAARLRETSDDFGVNLGFFSYKHAAKTAASSPYDDLRTMEATLDRLGEVSGLPAERRWLRSAFEVHCYLPDECPGMVVFAGMLGETAVVLAGSEEHLLSHPAGASGRGGYSFYGSVMKGLQDLSRSGPEFRRWLAGGPTCLDDADDYMFSGVAGGEWTKKAVVQQTLAIARTKGTPMTIEALSRIFLVASYDGLPVAIGSPLYVRDAVNRGRTA